MKREALPLALLVALPMSLLAVAPARAATKISSFGYVINAPGTYQVTQDLSGSGNAITVLANNVDLHLGGHTLTGTPGIEGAGVLVLGQSNVSIHHGTVQSFKDGIRLEGTLNSTVSHLTARQHERGIFVLAGASGISVIDNTVYQSDAGIRLYLSPRACTVARNTTYQNGTGIFLSDGAFANTVVNNTATQNTNGIVIQAGATQNTIQSNTANSNNGPGIILLNGANDNTVAGNTANLNNLGIWVVDDSTGNTLQGNTALTNRDVDLRDDSSDCDSNIWASNTFVTDNVAGASDGGPATGCIQ